MDYFQSQSRATICTPKNYSSLCCEICYFFVLILERIIKKQVNNDVSIVSSDSKINIPSKKNNKTFVGSFTYVI